MKNLVQNCFTKGAKDKESSGETAMLFASHSVVIKVQKGSKIEYVDVGLCMHKPGSKRPP